MVENKKSELIHTNLLIAGDSHLQKALNPLDLISAKSICQTAEPYMVTYWKLKYLEKTYQCDTLILGFSHHNFSSFNDLKFIDNTWSNEMYKRTYLIEHFSDIDSKYYNKNDYYKTYFKEMCIYPNKNHFRFIGGFKNVGNKSVMDSEKAIKRHFYINGTLADVSTLQSAYLDSIYFFCKTNNVELILASSPTYIDYSKKIPQIYLNLFQEKKEEFKNRTIIIVDKYNSSYPKELYLNSDHLNLKGSKKYATEIKKVLNGN